MLYTKLDQTDNLRTLRDLIANLPGDQYSQTSFGDNITAENILTLPPAEWTGPACALGHAFRSGMFAGLVVSLETRDCHRTVFGDASEYLFGDDYIPTDAPREGEPARLAMLASIDALLAVEQVAA